MSRTYFGIILTYTLNVSTVTRISDTIHELTSWYSNLLHCVFSQLLQNNLTNVHADYKFPIPCF